MVGEGAGRRGTGSGVVFDTFKKRFEKNMIFFLRNDSFLVIETLIQT